MTLFAVRHKETLRYWTGEWAGWSPYDGNAKTFACHQDAYTAAFAGCNVDPAETEIVQITRFEDREIAAHNDAIVKAHSERWLRNG